jgi:signal transduction histidine kinase
MAAGTRAAVATGFGFGASRYLGLVFGFDGSAWSLDHVASFVLFVVTALVSAYLLERMVASDKSISTFRAREEVARTLHDGVLQTLAVIQRRSDDDELVKLARTQEHELREYLFSGAEKSVDLGASLREVARRAEERYGFRVEVVIAPDLSSGTADRIHALKGAVTEALTNAHKHGGATKVTVYAEPASEHSWEAFVSVKDNGSGFDASAVNLGEGLTRSITERVHEAGGQVEVDGRPDRGAEIKLWL